MPNRALTVCAHPGCAEIVRGGLCARHERERGQGVRNPAWQRLYNLKAWKVRRLHQLAREPWCAQCLADGVYTPATDADHIVPHRGDVHLFLTGALQSLCHRHHSAKTAEEVGWSSPPGGRGAKKI